MEKCEFQLPSIEYLGHIISKDGIRAMPSKVEAIVRAPTPANVRQLRSFLGLINYYGKFIPNLATLLHPLIAVLKPVVNGVGRRSVRKLSKMPKIT